jgi:hypothetical protein
MATLKTNTLTGTSTAGSIAVTGEGNSTTTNLQQGLAKVWGSVTVSAVSDSLNVSGLTDNDTGDFTFAYTNNMASQNYTTQHQPQDVAALYLIPYIPATANVATSSLRIYYGYSSNNTGGITRADHDLANFSHHGDLA